MKKIEELTIGEARQKLEEYKELAQLFGKEIESSDNGSSYEIEKNYFIRTVTHHYTGKLVSVYPKELVLSQAAWIADDGRFTKALEEEEFDEVEIFPKDRLVTIGRGAILDAVQINKLPTKQK